MDVMLPDKESERSRNVHGPELLPANFLEISPIAFTRVCQLIKQGRIPEMKHRLVAA